MGVRCLLFAATLGVGFSERLVLGPRVPRFRVFVRV